MKQFFSQNIINLKSFYAVLMAGYVMVSLAVIGFVPQYAPFIILLLCFVPFAVYVLFTKVHVMFLLYIASIPFIQHASFAFLNVGGFNITPHMMAQFVLLISLLSVSILFRSKKDLAYSGTDKALMIFFVVSILPLMIGYTFNVNHVRRWLLFYTGIFEPLVIYFSLRYLLASRRVNERSLLIALVCTSFAAVIVAFMEFTSIGFDPILIFSSRMRFGFGYHNTNLFGIHSALLFPLTVYVLTDEKYSKYRALAFASFGILVILSILCFNRGTILVLGFQTILLFIQQRNRRIIYFMVLCLGMLALIFSNVLIFYILRFIAGGGAEVTPTVLDTSANIRFEAWRVGLLVLLKYPLGIGADSFQYMWEMYGSLPNVFVGTPHQLLLSIGVDYGVPCLLIFLAVYFSAVSKARRIYSADAVNNPLYRYIVISLIGFGIYGLITDGELSHLTGRVAANNGYTLILFSLVALIEQKYSEVNLNRK